MSDLDRRTFLGVLAALPAAALPRDADAHAYSAHHAALAADSAPRATSLRALADAILPTELGDDGLTRAAEQFQRWLDGNTPGAELDHGYGTGTLRYTPADPRPQWRTQLEQLDTEARAKHNRAFDALDRNLRRELVAAQLNALNIDRIPAPLSARHVAAALLGWFYATPTAHDLCYGARITPLTCRPLNDVANRPQPLGTRRPT
jgi:hypothetical protein